ncbi:tetratricopeptide repeat protein 12 isoform X3 [Drosophila hydei]|nr:tetratricopeptide repeat protein 12 isoform X3 [Drosophila hydei]XP_023178827.1 tetratricopeptide repeat protein 12 isoform X3 [Drosophila hydei]
MNQFTFMRQIDKSVQERMQARIERERVANNFRRLGNSAYRKAQFSTAIELYNHGLDYVNDTPVLYLNRACCYIRLRDFKRAIIDCDYILHKFDPKHIRAWLYRALSFKRLHVENSFNECISEVKRLNSRDIAFIDGFLERMRSAP